MNGSEGVPGLLWVLEAVIAGRLSDVPVSTLQAARDATRSFDLPHTRLVINMELRHRIQLSRVDRWRSAAPVAVGGLSEPSPLVAMALVLASRGMLGAMGREDLTSTLAELTGVCDRIRGELTRRHEARGRDEWAR